MTKQKQNKVIVVYRMDYAMALKDMGHIVKDIMPNPQKPYLNCWIFEKDASFDEDLSNLQKGGKQ